LLGSRVKTITKQKISCPEKTASGAGIGWHHDSPAFGIVAGIALGATLHNAVSTWEGEDRHTAAVELPSRSIYLLTGDARDLWQHRIAPIHELRYSVTMRTLR
jgi:alkylated DNA repair dioxygenase AlkB